MRINISEKSYLEVILVNREGNICRFKFMIRLLDKKTDTDIFVENFVTATFQDIQRLYGGLSSLRDHKIAGFKFNTPDNLLKVLCKPSEDGYTCLCNMHEPSDEVHISLIFNTGTSFINDVTSHTQSFINSPLGWKNTDSRCIQEEGTVQPVIRIYKANYVNMLMVELFISHCYIKREIFYPYDELHYLTDDISALSTGKKNSINISINDLLDLTIDYFDNKYMLSGYICDFIFPDWNQVTLTNLKSEKQMIDFQ